MSDCDFIKLRNFEFSKVGQNEITANVMNLLRFSSKQQNSPIKKSQSKLLSTSKVFVRKCCILHVRNLPIHINLSKLAKTLRNSNWNAAVFWSNWSFAVQIEFSSLTSVIGYENILTASCWVSTWAACQQAWNICYTKLHCTVSMFWDLESVSELLMQSSRLGISQYL